MLKVLIVDDETIIRVGIKSIINWQKHGFELIGEASNGKEAFEIIKKEKPDIVLTDIQMPILNGVELITKVKDLGYNTEFIVLSCHDDFELVKEVMKKGVDEYFLKLNMEPEILLEELVNIKNKILSKNLKRKKEHKMEKNIYQNIPVMQEKFFKDIIFGNIYDENDIKDKMKLLEINLTNNSLYCLSILIDHFYKYEEYGDSHVQLINFSILNIIKELLNDFMPGYVFYNKPGKFVIILSSSNEKVNSNNSKVLDLAAKTRDYLKKYLDISVSIGISKKFNNIKNISKGYFEAEKALEYKFFKGEQSIIKIDEVIFYNEPSDLQLINISNGVIDYILNNDIEGLKTYLNDISKVIIKKGIKKESANILCLKIIMGFINHLHDEEEKIDEYLGENYDPNKDINRLESLQDIENWLEWLKEKIINFMLIQLEKSNKNIIHKAKKFVKENYKYPITMNDIAEYLNISPSYFSNYFKKETGESVTQYITNIRIQKAKEYIKNTDMKMYEIAESVGYNNVYYFSKVFKKNVGESPVKFKERF